MSNTGFTSQIVHYGHCADSEYGAVHAAVHPSTEYTYDDAHELAAVFQNRKKGYTYGRTGTPTTAALEAQVTAMEQGIGTVAFATGMAALNAVFFALLRHGDHLVASKYIFGNTNSLLMTLENFGVEITLVDATDAARVQAALRPNTRMVFVETIANPGTQIADLKAIGDICQAHKLVYVVDSTLSSPYLRPSRDFGASLVVNSLSKHIGGHGNALGGAVTQTGLYDWADFPHIYEQYRKDDSHTWGLLQIKKKGLRDMGGTLSSDVAHRLSAGAETIALRMDRICGNALALARFLESHPLVERVQYPGLASHPQHQRSAEFFGGRHGGLLGVVLKDHVDVFDCLNRLRVAALATHLGDNRTLVLPAAHTIYYEMGPERRALMGIPDAFLRISVGIEEEADLIGDFAQALENR
ncbi:cystathionine gamma-synthase family protein [uncultured Castellaniella sp.]|uniref:cystathionine gamma-synthase family protein n=1 Tax=uncultured Castellaniella sp. TaxID=647907 RepID=UPI002612AD56|nr:cystathionine gamma-synthase family protein [uncultured Castellaniella sp.]